jgi:hypothetical protein
MFRMDRSYKVGLKIEGHPCPSVLRPTIEVLVP